MLKISLIYTYVINNKPNGTNINNNAGSTHIEGLQKFVVEKGLDVGFAYDGDADRCLCVDEKGNVITGDHILYTYSKKQSSEQISRKLSEFIKEIQYKNRNPVDNNVLKMLQEMETNPELLFDSQQYLYRSRIVHSKDKLNGEYPFFGFGKDGSFVAPSECTKDMRANYRYIPYLYCATRPYLSVVEVRPRLGARVSVARIRVNERLRLLDFSLQNYPKGMKSVKINLFHALSQLYSKPVTEDDDTLDYIPTQYIAEFVKRIGYDGIVFKSSLYNDENSVNVVIFNFDKCEAVGSVVYDVTRNDYTCEMEDPVSELRLNLQLQLTPNNN